MVDLTVLDKLRTFDTPTICNLIELFNVRSHTAGYMDRRITARFPELPPMVGFASTVTVRSAAPPDRDAGYDWLGEHVRRFEDLPGPVVVVQQDLDDPLVAATFGEVMCTSYQAFGAVGLVSSGSGRDLEQVRALGFPVFTDGVVASHGYFRAVDIHVPVQVGGVVVAPGELIHGDLNGVTTIPLAIAAELAAVGDEFVAAEGLILEAVRGDDRSPERLDSVRAEAQAIFASLRERVARR